MGSCVQQLGAASGDIDVFTQDVIWPAEFASAGWAMDLSSEFPQAERDKFFPGLVQSVTWQDKLVGLPFYLDAGQLYYRKDVLKDKGMKVPTTWQELATSAKALQGSGDIKNGFLWQGKQAEVLVCNVVSFVGGAGGAILGPDGKTVMIADQPAQTAIQFMYDTMNSLNITPKDVLSWDEEPSRKPFTAGNAAFLRQWSYVWKVSQDASQSQVVGKVGVAPLPHFPGGKSAACLGGYQLGVSESSKNKDGAVEFLRWMTSLDTQIRYAELFGSNPALRSAYADPRLAKVSPAMVQLKDVFEGGRLARLPRSTRRLAWLSSQPSPRRSPRATWRAISPRSSPRSRKSSPRDHSRAHPHRHRGGGTQATDPAPTCRP